MGMLNPASARTVSRALKYSDRVVAVSEFNKEEILKYTQREKVTKIYNAANYNEFHPGTHKDRLVVTVSIDLSDRLGSVNTKSHFMI